MRIVALAYFFLGYAQEVFDDSLRPFATSTFDADALVRGRTSNALAGLLLQMIKGYPGLRHSEEQLFSARSARASPHVTMQFDGIMEKLGLKKDEKMTKEEEKEMEDRMKAGEMTLDDYVKSIDLMDKATMMKSLMSRFGGDERERAQMDAVMGKFKRHKSICEYLEDEERQTPMLLVDEYKAVSAKPGTPIPRIRRIAEDAGLQPEQVCEFIFEFDTMRQSAAGLANGEDPEIVKQKIMKERQSQTAGPKLNRQQRREAKKKRKAEAAKR